MTTIDTTPAANAAQSNQATSSEGASSIETTRLDPIAQAKAKLDALRAEMQAAEANLAAQQAAAEELKAVAEAAKRAELAELPARYGFKDMRALVGHLSYYHLRGAKQGSAAPRQRGQKRQTKARRPTKAPVAMSDTQRERLFEDLRKGGKSVIQLSKEYHISRARIYQLVQSNDLPLPSQQAA